jgi:hypothetical protein
VDAQQINQIRGSRAAVKNSGNANKVVVIADEPNGDPCPVQC